MPGPDAENTIPGFLKAVEFGVSTLEMDAISRDNRVILSHDQWFNAAITTKPNGKYILPSEEKYYNLYKMVMPIIKPDVGLKLTLAFHISKILLHLYQSLRRCD